MSARRVRPAEALAGAAGVALLASLFATWYSVGVDVDGAGARLIARVDGWSAFAVIDLVLGLAAASGIALLAAQLGRRTPALPVALAVVTSAAGVLATLLVLYRLLDAPGPDEFVDISGGAWLGLAGAVALLAGGWWSMATERVRDVPVPRVEVRPAPPAS